MLWLVYNHRETNTSIGLEWGPGVILLLLFKEVISVTLTDTSDKYVAIS